MEKQGNSRKIKEVCQGISGKAEEISDGAHKKMEKVWDESYKALETQSSLLLENTKALMVNKFINNAYDPSEAYTACREKVKGAESIRLNPSYPRKQINVYPREGKVIIYAQEEIPESVKKGLKKVAYRNESEYTGRKYWIKDEEIANEVEIPEVIEEASDKLLEAMLTVSNHHLLSSLESSNEVSKENFDVMGKTAKNIKSLKELL